MKNTKNLIVAAAIAVLIAPALNSCKKGDGDPFLSLRSRKARVTGEWNVTSYKDHSTYTNESDGGGLPYSSSGTVVVDVNGATVNRTTTDSDSQGTTTATGSGKAEVKVIFEKDGKFSQLLRFTNMIMDYNGEEQVENRIVESSGTWNFLGSVEEDYKNKERVILNITRELNTISVASNASGGYTIDETRIETYANGENSEIWHITTLRNKKMVVEGTRNTNGSYSSSINFGGGASTTSGTYSEKGTMSATLEQ